MTKKYSTAASVFLFMTMAVGAGILRAAAAGRGLAGGLPSRQAEQRRGGLAGGLPSRQAEQRRGVRESTPQTQEPEFADLAGPGKKNKIDETTSFTWEFVQKPKLGPAILKIQLFDRDGTRRTDLAIIGRSDMPSMRGAHDSGDAAFKLNKKGDYLLPVNIVMPGDWEVLLTFKNGDAVVFRGRIAFNV